MKTLTLIALLTLAITAHAEVQIGNQLIKTSDECIVEEIEATRIGIANDQCGGGILPISTDQFVENHTEITLRNGCSAYETNVNHMLKLAAKTKALFVELKPVKTNAAAKAKFCAGMMEETASLRN